MKLTKILQIQSNYQSHRKRLSSIHSQNPYKKVSQNLTTTITKINSYNSKKYQSTFHRQYEHQRSISISNEKLHRKLENVYARDTEAKVRREVLGEGDPGGGRTKSSRQGSLCGGNSRSSIRSEQERISVENSRISRKLAMASSGYKKFREGARNKGKSRAKRAQAKRDELIRILEKELGCKPQVVFPRVMEKKGGKQCVDTDGDGEYNEGNNNSNIKKKSKSLNIYHKNPLIDPNSTTQKLEMPKNPKPIHCLTRPYTRSITNPKNTNEYFKKPSNVKPSPNFDIGPNPYLKTQDNNNSGATAGSKVKYSFKYQNRNKNKHKYMYTPQYTNYMERYYQGNPYGYGNQQVDNGYNHHQFEEQADQQYNPDSQQQMPRHHPDRKTHKNTQNYNRQNPPSAPKTKYIPHKQKQRMRDRQLVQKQLKNQIADIYTDQADYMFNYNKSKNRDGGSDRDRDRGINKEKNGKKINDHNTYNKANYQVGIKYKEIKHNLRNQRFESIDGGSKGNGYDKDRKNRDRDGMHIYNKQTQQQYKYSNQFEQPNNQRQQTIIAQFSKTDSNSNLDNTPSNNSLKQTKKNTIDHQYEREGQLIGQCEEQLEEQEGEGEGEYLRGKGGMDGENRGQLQYQQEFQQQEQSDNRVSNNTNQHKPQGNYQQPSAQNLQHIDISLSKNPKNPHKPTQQ